MQTQPKPLEFPKNLNPHAVELWFKACQKLPEGEGNKEAWRMAMHTYTELCHSLDLDPFYTGERNAAIRNYLYAQRRRFIVFMDRTKIMQNMKILRLIKRRVEIRPYGFDITVSAQLEIHDPTWIKGIFKYPLGYRFGLLRNSKRQYIARPDPGIEVFVFNDMINSPIAWHIGYTIKCPIAPEYEGLEPKSYILNQMWKPIARSFRGKKTDPIRYI